MFSLSYVQNLQELKREFVLRENSNCQYRARKHLIEKFGFDPEDYNLNFEGVGMWRQFFGLHFENIVAEVFCRIYSFERFDLTYKMDGFTTRNPFKYSLVKPKFAKKIGNGWRVIKYPLSDNFRERQVIEDVKISGGTEKAVDFHEKLAKKMKFEQQYADISSFLSGFVHSALLNLNRSEIARIFDSVFIVKKHNGIKVREKLKFNKECYMSKSGSFSIEEIVELSADGAVFPSAKTYYSELYFFIPGILAPSYAQIEALFELADEKISIPAEKGFRRCKEVTGYYPLILPMPDFNQLKEFRFTKNPACACICTEITADTSFSGNFYNDFMDIGEKIIKS